LKTNCDSLEKLTAELVFNRARLEKIVSEDRDFQRIEKEKGGMPDTLSRKERKKRITGEKYVHHTY